MPVLPGIGAELMSITRLDDETFTRIRSSMLDAGYKPSADLYSGTVGFPADDRFPLCPRCGSRTSCVNLTPGTLRGGRIVFEGCEHDFAIPVSAGEACPVCGGSGLIVQGDGSVVACPRSPGPGHY